MNRSIFEIYKLKREKAAQNYKMECAQESSLRAHLQAISMYKLPSEETSVSTMQLTGYDDRWLVWSDNRRITLNQKLALCLAKKDQKRRVLARRLAEMIAQRELIKSFELQQRQNQSLRCRTDFQDLMLLQALQN